MTTENFLSVRLRFNDNRTLSQLKEKSIVRVA